MSARNNALLRGEIHYIGRPCRLGHVIRRCSSTACRDCERQRAREYHHKDPARTAARARRRYAVRRNYYRGYLRARYAAHAREINMRRAQKRFDARATRREIAK